MPAIIDPSTVPIKLDATVSPCNAGDKVQSDWIVFSAPDITAVSNPNKKPPKEAIKAIRTGYESIISFVPKNIRYFP